MNGVYTSYFLAVPLPLKYLKKFRALIETLNNLYPEIPTVNAKTPHFTLYYLRKDAETNLKLIRNRIEESIYLLQECQITVGGFNLFGEERPRLLFLAVDCPPEVAQFNQMMSESLTEYSAEDNQLGFYPHVSVASTKEPKAFKVFERNKKKIVNLFNEIKWNFKIEKIVLYGANSNQRPELQLPIFEFSI